jgi:magnesium transporter
MIIVYLINAGQLERREIETGDDVPKQAVWVDLIEPTEEEERLIERQLDIDTPARRWIKTR